MCAASERGGKKRNQILRHYIQEHLAQQNYSHLVNPQKLCTEGEYYHLETIYARLNEYYFNGELKLAITWFGEKGGERRSRITFGQYLSGLRLIKIHRLLDHPFFPDFFVSFVIYHEMLHSVIPGSVDRGGRFCVHGPEFKHRERAFKEYEKAILWEQKNKSYFYSARRIDLLRN